MKTFLHIITFVPKVALCAVVLTAMLLLVAFVQMEGEQP